MKILFKNTEEIKGKIVGDYGWIYEIELEAGGVIIVSKADITIVESVAVWVETWCKAVWGVIFSDCFMCCWDLYNNEIMAYQLARNTETIFIISTLTQAIPKEKYVKSVISPTIVPVCWSEIFHNLIKYLLVKETKIKWNKIYSNYNNWINPRNKNEDPLVFPGEK